MIKPGTLVRFHLGVLVENMELGLVVRGLDWEEKRGDPFPMWEVLFSDGGLLKCRERDLKEVEG